MTIEKINQFLEDERSVGIERYEDIYNFKVVDEFVNKSDKIIFNIDEDLELDYHILDLLYFSDSKTRVINPKIDDLPRKYRNKLKTKISNEYFDKYLFYNCESHNIIGIPYVNYFNKRLKFSNEMNFDNDKLKIWYVRNDNCADFVYGDNRDQIESTIPLEIVEMINKKELFLVLSTGSEFDCDHFWDKVVNYCVGIGIDEKNIHFITSNIKTQLPNSHSFKYSGLPHSKYDVGVCWLDKYGDIFPYTDEYIDRFKNVDKEKKFLCLNAHYREHRHYLYYKLFHNDLLSKGIFFYIRSRYQSC